MTEQEAKIKDLELRVKKLEDKVFDTWLAQYEPKANWTQEAKDEWYNTVKIEDFPPLPSTQACSLEDQMEQTKKWSEFISKHPEYR